MRLLNIETLQIEEFIASPPPYVALSHTWGNEEISLQELNSPDFKRTCKKNGWTKILDFCQTVKNSQLEPPIQYIWVDTCCIDKTSSAELSEAINSMFRWYRESVSCFAYMIDVGDGEGNLGLDFDNARWFTRGFALQELLAPTDVQFFNRDWQYVGDRKSLAGRISKVTRIPQNILLDGNIHYSSVAQKLSWTADRQTTRPEDIAYCLLGLLDVNMPLLYGEGDKAFIRLQEEIIKENDDQSIFVWDASDMNPRVGRIGALSPSPKYFSGCGQIQSLAVPIGEELTISSKGISIHLPFKRRMSREAEAEKKALAHLSCFVVGDIGCRVGIILLPDWPDTSRYIRAAAPPKAPKCRCSVQYYNLQWKRSIPDGLWIHNAAAQLLTLDFPAEAVPEPAPAYLYTMAQFENDEGKAFAVELHLETSTGRLSHARLVDLTSELSNEPGLLVKAIKRWLPSSDIGGSDKPRPSLKIAVLEDAESLHMMGRLTLVLNSKTLGSVEATFGVQKTLSTPAYTVVLRDLGY